MPFQAILRHDLRTLRSSWLVRLWLVGTVLLTFLVASSNWARLQTAPLVALLLVPYLVFPWFLVVMVLGVNPLSGVRLEALADGFLSRPITRQEYLLAIWAARVIIVLTAYLAVMVPAVAIVVLAKRPVPADQVTLYGLIAAGGVVGLVLSFQVSLAFLVGTWLRRPLVAVVVLLFLWYPVNTVMDVFRLEAFSPISLSRALPNLLRQPWPWLDQTDSNPVDALQIEALQQQAANFLNILSGSAPARPRQPDGDFFADARYKDFSLLRIALGYGLSTVAAVGLATLIFSLRDL